MHYWRKGYFESLKEVAAAAERECPPWREYADFCLEYERGLRGEAFIILDRFIQWMERAPFEDRRRFTSWLLFQADDATGHHMLIPHPLQTRIIEPTLWEWVEVDPLCSEPLRWLGGYENLTKAIELDPSDEIARRKLIIVMLSRVGYAIHELPSGYLGNPSDDLETLTRAEMLLSDLSNPEERAKLAGAIADEKTTILRFLK